MLAVRQGGLKVCIGFTGISERRGAEIASGPLKQPGKEDKVIHLIRVIKAQLICSNYNESHRT